jgi:hypothetical protein
VELLIILHALRVYLELPWTEFPSDYAPFHAFTSYIAVQHEELEILKNILARQIPSKNTALTFPCDEIYSVARAFLDHSNFPEWRTAGFNFAYSKNASLHVALLIGNEVLARYFSGLILPEAIELREVLHC